MNLFVYGTLTYPKIVEALTGNTFVMQAAELHDFQVTGIKRRPYPGIITKQGAVATGFILFDIDERAMKIIDAWEGNEYQRQEVIAVTAHKRVDVSAYIWRGDITKTRTWSRSNFGKVHLDTYLNEKIPTFKKAMGL